MSNVKEVIPLNNDIDELATLINLPLSPQEATWNVTMPNIKHTRGSVPGPSDYGHSLDALIGFSQDDLETLRAQASGHVLRQDIEWGEFAFQTRPRDSLKEMFTYDAESRTYRLEVPLYDASELFGKPPYSKGSFFITPSGNVYLNLYTE